MIRWAFDLEFEQPQGKINKAGVVEVIDSETDRELIIEIGAVVFDTKTGEIISIFEGFVNNNIKLSTFIKDLTHITQEQVDSGKSLKEVMKDLDKWLKKYKAFRQPICWGIDAETLRNVCNENKIKWQYAKASMNIKTVYQMLMEQQGKNHGGGLNVSLKGIGIDFKGIEHRGTMDALNTAAMYMYIAKRLRVDVSPKEVEEAIDNLKSGWIEQSLWNLRQIYNKIK